MQKNYFDEQGNFIIRPYRLTDLAAIYGVSRHTVRRWINDKAPAYGKKTKKYFTVEQVNGIITALGVPQKITPVIVMQPLQPLRKAS